MFPTERYAPLEVIGSGSSGVIYKCRDLYLNKNVAVKSLKNINPEQVVSFQQEAKMISSLNHRNIIKCLDFGVSDSGNPYMVVELIEGQSLEDYLAKNKKGSNQFARRLLEQLSLGLEQAHERGIMHRDLKPANVMLVFDNQSEQFDAKIIDFGTAKIQANLQDSTFYQGKTLVGTPAYMSPDQANGKSFDERSDIYSLGCMMYETLSGKVPFIANSSLEVISMHANKKVKKLPDSVSPELIEIIELCLKKNPDDRFNKVTSLINYLNATKHTTRESQAPPEVTGESSLDKKSLPNFKLICTSGGLIFMAIIFALYLIPKEKSEPKKAKKFTVNKVITEKPRMKELTFIKAPSGYVLPANLFEFKDEDMRFLKGKNYKSISFHNLDTNGSGLSYLQDEPIERISFNDTGITDKSLRLMKNFKNLNTLHLMKTGISFDGLKQLGGLKKITTVALSGSKNINDACLDLIIKNYPKLKILWISNTEITDRSIKKLVKVKTLRNLHVSGLPITDDTVIKLRKLRLNTLFLNDTKVSDKAVIALKSNKSLRLLSLRNCPNISGKARSALAKANKNLKIVKYLDRTLPIDQELIN